MVTRLAESHWGSTEESQEYKSHSFGLLNYPSYHATAWKAWCTCHTVSPNLGILEQSFGQTLGYQKEIRILTSEQFLN